MLTESVLDDRELFIDSEKDPKHFDISPLIDQCLSVSDMSDIDGLVNNWLKKSLHINKDTRSDQLQFVLQQAYLSISKIINKQLDAILHHPKVKSLEASWRGLEYLTDIESDYDENLTIKVKVLNISWRELGKDLGRAIEFDQSNIFKRIYSDEFDTPGGEPFGVILGDYSISHRPVARNSISDLEIIKLMADISAAALCPFITSVKPSLFGLDTMRDLAYPLDLTEIFKQKEYYEFNKLRSHESTRFVGLTLPNMLMRKPYLDDDTRNQIFHYQEQVSDPDLDLLWGNSCYSFGSVLVRAFANTGWFADIRGGEHEFGEGGVVRHLNYARHSFEKNNMTPRAATNTQVDDFLERELSDLGFIPLSSYHSVEKSVYYSNSSMHKSTEYTSETANANAKLSAMIQYMMCVSRFGHYVKVIGRDKIGSFTGPEECQRIFQNWLNQYTTSSDTNSSELKARYPLSKSNVEIKEKIGSPGNFNCIMHLQPHFQLDQLVSSIKLITELAVGATTATISKN